MMCTNQSAKAWHDTWKKGFHFKPHNTQTQNTLALKNQCPKIPKAKKPNIGLTNWITNKYLKGS